MSPFGGGISGTALKPSGVPTIGPPSRPAKPWLDISPHAHSQQPLPLCRWRTPHNEGKQQPELNTRPAATSSDAKRTRVICHLCLLCSNGHEERSKGLVR